MRSGGAPSVSGDRVDQRRRGAPPGSAATAAVAVLVTLLVAASTPTPALAQPTPDICGTLRNAYGPLDYRKYRDITLTRVEDGHFTPEVEALLRGRSGALGGDIDYTLRAFPNHHRALVSVMRWAEKTKSPRPPSAERPLECYFERALRFTPDDLLVRMIYASFLKNASRGAEAQRQLEMADAAAADNAFTHYNIGLIYLEMKLYERALQQAHVAAGLGFTLPALRDGLKAAGKWSEPPAEAAASAPAAAASLAGASGVPGVSPPAGAASDVPARP